MCGRTNFLSCQASEIENRMTDKTDMDDSLRLLPLTLVLIKDRIDMSEKSQTTSIPLIEICKKLLVANV